MAAAVSLMRDVALGEVIIRVIRISPTKEDEALAALAEQKEGNIFPEDRHWSDAVFLAWLRYH